MKSTHMEGVRHQSYYQNLSIGKRCSSCCCCCCCCCCL
ncbi:unnamed protein product [Spirodela intermedia]|uniref:Uncharacterized protein n=1 Tax=Spirodela intermedia TaxID=51605 RepID=A0ABN7E842_SPIIN|nr:unnamed protein product [Spirodela intermedia]